MDAYQFSRLPGHVRLLAAYAILQESGEETRERSRGWFKSIFHCDDQYIDEMSGVNSRASRGSEIKDEQ